MVSVKALGGNCSGTRGDAGTANPGPDRDITKGTGRDKTGTSPDKEGRDITLKNPPCRGSLRARVRRHLGDLSALGATQYD